MVLVRFSIAVFFLIDIFMCEDIVITTTSGQLRGEVKEYGENRITIFRGVPYAEPPTGDRRFQKPVPVQSWEGIRNVTVQRPPCMQEGPMMMSEDCLFLDIYVPVKIGTSDLLEVVVFFHGLFDDFSHSAGIHMDGSPLAIRGQQIFVSLSYRVGLFGFLSTNTSDYPGNYGLWDQLMAMSWVHDNIDKFAGNPNKITLWGNSAGGTSVFLHSISPSSRGKFQRVIVQSGFGLSPNTLATDPIMTLTRVGKALDCTTSYDPSATVACIKTKDARSIVSATAQFSRGALSLDGKPAFIQWIGPVVDGDFLPDTPDNLLSDNTTESYAMFTTTGMLIGMTDGEGMLTTRLLESYQNIYHFDFLEGIPSAVLCDIVAPGISNQFYGGSIKVSEAICEYYKTSGSESEQARKIVQVYRDFLYVVPMMKAMRVHPNMEDYHRYLYVFEHEPQHGSVLGRPPWLSGAVNYDDVIFLFDLEKHLRWGQKVSEEEMLLSNQMKDMWASFVRTG